MGFALGIWPARTAHRMNPADHSANDTRYFRANWRVIECMKLNLPVIDPPFQIRGSSRDSMAGRFFAELGFSIDVLHPPIKASVFARQTIKQYLAVSLSHEWGQLQKKCAWRGRSLSDMIRSNTSLKPSVLASALFRPLTMHASE